MTKQDAINKFGIVIVATARSYYETNAGKVLFAEDVRYMEEDIPANEETQLDYLWRAYHNKNK